MKNRWKFALAFTAILVVGGAVVWADALPSYGVSRGYSAGSLAGAVAAACDPERTGTFTDGDLQMAITCRDLAAQESMALSTARLVWLSWLQIFAAVAAAGTVLWTVLIALRSMELTRQSLKHQQDATRLQLRPSFERKSLKVTDVSGGGLHVEFRFRNVGNLPARRVRKALAHVVTPRADGLSKISKGALKFQDGQTMASRGGQIGTRIKLGPAQAALIRAGTHSLQVAFACLYDDDLGGEYRYGVVTEFSGPDLKHDRMLKKFAFDLPGWKGRSF